MSRIPLDMRDPESWGRAGAGGVKYIVFGGEGGGGGGGGGGARGILSRAPRGARGLKCRCSPASWETMSRAPRGARGLKFVRDD